MRVALVFSAVLAACVGPQVDDEVAPSGEILPEGSTVEDAEDDPEIAAQIRDSDGVDGLIPRISAFAGGSRVWYWDFGPEQRALAPIFVLSRRTSGGALEAIDHKVVVGSIPGDPGYSAFWVRVDVVVTDSYDGERLTSVTAIDEAVELGLVESPVVQEAASNCPIVASDSRLQLGGGEDDLPPENWFYWRGKKVYFYSFGALPIDSASSAVTTKLLRLSRVGEPPLSELERGVDITGDGDTTDSNDIIGLRFDQPGASPACEVVEVAVPATPGAPNLIDSSMDEQVSDFNTASVLFDPDPVPGNVVAFEETGELRNCVQQRVTGGL